MAPWRHPRGEVSKLAADKGEPYLKYALFCRDTQEGPDDELVLEGIIDLVDLPKPGEGTQGGNRVLAELDVQLAFCIGGATPGPRSFQKFPESS